MSVPVELDRLRDEIAGFDTDPYLLTVGDDGRPHTVAVSWSWERDELVMPAGNTTTANARARPHVTVLWPPARRGGHSLIVDGAVTRAAGRGDGDNVVAVQPTRAVLHRPATPANAGDSACGADCAPVLPSVD